MRRGRRRAPTCHAHLVDEWLPALGVTGPLAAGAAVADVGCWGHLVVAPLWVVYDANLGPLLRTCDAVGACLAVLRTPHYRQALSIGDTLRGRRPCLHWVSTTKPGWIAEQRDEGKRLVAVELADGATPLPRLSPARVPTVLLLGHEHHGVPDEVLADVDIPTVGWGASLDVAIAGSLVAYRLAGFS